MGSDETYDDGQLNPPEQPIKEHLSTGIFNNIEINSNNEYYYIFLRHIDKKVPIINYSSNNPRSIIKEMIMLLNDDWRIMFVFN